MVGTVRPGITTLGRDSTLFEGVLHVVVVDLVAATGTVLVATKSRNHIEPCGFALALVGTGDLLFLIQRNPEIPEVVRGPILLRCRCSVSLEVGLQTSMALPSFTSPYSVCQSISADESTRWLEWLDQESPPWVGIVPCSRESFMLWLSILLLLLELGLLLSMDGAAASLMTRPLLRRRQ